MSINEDDLYVPFMRDGGHRLVVGGRCGWSLHCGGGGSLPVT